MVTISCPKCRQELRVPETAIGTTGCCKHCGHRFMASPGRSHFKDFSLWTLVLANVSAAVIAFLQQWPVGSVMAVYWVQSVIIGACSAGRMAMLRQFSTAGLKSNGRPVPETSKGKFSVVTFFLFHYNFFHLGYFVFLMAGGAFLAEELPWIILGACIFGINSFHTFRRQIASDLQGRPNIGTLMFLPYARIVPMHLCICIGVGLKAAGGMGDSFTALLLFMGLKTAADVLMEVVERSMYRKTADRGVR